jgi:putative peptide zinc metalloprotease protein
VPDLALPLPCRRQELVLRPLGENGLYVLKDPRTGAYYHLGDEEHFLLTHLDGEHDAEAIQSAFEERFGEPLTDEDLQELLDMAQAQGLLETPGGEGQPPQGVANPGIPGSHSPMDAAGAVPLGLRILYWRKSLFDPDRLFTWLAPKIGFFWTPAFLLFSAACIVLAAGVMWTNRQAVAGSFLSALRWESAIVTWLVLMVVTTCHEFAHGLTCKRHGGEVHEVGFLMLFFMPCFFCNVSDAWLFPEKSKRLWVTLAGGYFELFLWALAVFVWRLTLPGTLPHYLAFIVVSACGVQTLFNFNPLLKLDGYYLLSDWAEIPNLHQRAADCVRAHARWLLWGAPRPMSEPRCCFLLVYGSLSLLYSLVFLVLMLVGLAQLAGPRLGGLGLAAAGLLTLVSVRGLASGFSSGEVTTMFRLRCKRTAVWCLSLGAAVAGLFLVPIEDRVGGPFQVRPTVRAELRAPVAGFLRTVHCDEGDRVSSQTLVARLEVPDLAHRLAQKKAEIREGQARLRLLEIGTRYEELNEQRRRVERAEAWRDLGRNDLQRGREALQEDLERLDKQVARYQAEGQQSREVLERCRRLLLRRAVTEEEYREAQMRVKVCMAQEEQARAEKRARQARGTLEAEAELARREKELADVRATLVLMEAGSRPEEIDAERARLARLEEELRYLTELGVKLAVTSPVAGVITTPRLKEKVGQYLHEGDLIGVVEEPGGLEAEVALPEQDAARVQAGHTVKLKARATPLETVEVPVDRIAPAAGKAEVQSTVTVYCRLGDQAASLRPGMTGHARIVIGRRPPGRIFLDRALRYLCTEFWSWW